VCKEFGLSTKFMSLVLMRMTQAGLIASKRGTAGGYKLARPAAEVSLLDVIEAVDGPLDASEVRAAGFDSEAAAIVEGALAEVVADARIRLASLTLGNLLRATT
jgi:Rrf2 family protein